MDEILHHLRNPGTMIPLQIPTNSYFQPWFLRGANWISSIHGINQRSLGSTCGEGPVGSKEWQTECVLFPGTPPKKKRRSRFSCWCPFETTQPRGTLKIRRTRIGTKESTRLALKNAPMSLVVVLRCLSPAAGLEGTTVSVGHLRVGLFEGRLGWSGGSKEANRKPTPWVPEFGTYPLVGNGRNLSFLASRSRVAFRSPVGLGL